MSFSSTDYNDDDDSCAAGARLANPAEAAAGEL